MSGETLEQWAARRATQLDGEGWRWTNSDYYGDEWLEAVAPFPEGVTVLEAKQAIRDFRDKVAEGLDDVQREVLASIARHPDEVVWSNAAYELKDAGLVGPGQARRWGSRPGLAPLGSEIARVLEGGRRG